MRSVNFRDTVLWPIAYKLGLDPAVGLLADQADAFASYINAWVRRGYDGQDWPDITQVVMATPDSNHVVPYEIVSPMTPPTPAPVTQLGRILKVYLLDPATTFAPIDTPFRLLSDGIHVGFEHGPNVWIKHVPRCPVFTAKPWDPSHSFKKDEPTYSPLTGNCYKSKINANQNHDPSADDTSGDQALTIITTQNFSPANPGNPVAVPKIMELALSTDVAIPDPHPTGGTFQATIHDATGAILTYQQYVNPGSMSLATILTNWAALFQGALGAWTITVDTSRKVIRFQNASDFTITRPDGIDPAAYFHDTNDKQHLLKNYVVQPYLPTMAATQPLAQLTTINLGTNQLIPGGVYTLTFIDQSGVRHTVQYTAGTQDGAVQILAGLANAMGASVTPDTFFQDTSTSIDPVGQTLTITNRAPVGIDAGVKHPLPPQPPPPPGPPPGSAYWEVVLFPFVLVDQVVRGAYADALKEGGQSDKGGAEEQAVPAETAARTGALQSSKYDALTDQQKPRSRYAMR